MCPRCRKTFEGEVSGGGISPLVVPIADHNVPGNPVNRPTGAVLAGLPFAVSRRLGVDEAVAPHPQLLAAVLDDVLVGVVDGPGEEFGGVMAFAPRAVGVGDQVDQVVGDLAVRVVPERGEEELARLHVEVGIAHLGGSGRFD